QERGSASGTREVFRLSPKDHSEKDLGATAFSMKSELESSLNRFTKNPTDTEDIFQKLIQRLLTVRDRDVGAPLHYIRRSMRNAGIEWIRQQREPNQVVSIQSDDALNLIDPRPGPYETAAAQQELQR